MPEREVLVPLTPKTVVTCSRCKCQAQVRIALRDQWNTTMDKGVIAGFLCPRCQTPEENAEAEINQATLDYSVNAEGRGVAKPKRSED